jgi:hypothetical protein
LAQVHQVCQWLHDQAKAWEQHPTRLVTLDAAWIRTGRLGCMQTLLKFKRCLLQRTG